ncbi:unnamed protein product [Brassicogethes aeneus]|uniref:Galectin n=1 Tax=Brassicogethes aeneus TaxID=1431903 RepID=A0A9P0FEU9_BRAAE|nr:unnamed protein product [Brassicogethes aeneus]
MTSPIVNPDVPYVGEIPDWSTGKMVRVQGIVDPNADRFNINLQTGPNARPRDDTALHISVRLNQGYIARNAYIDGAWEDEQGTGSLPIGPNQHFEIIILNDEKSYKIAVNGQHHSEFPHKITSSQISHLLIDGDVHITVISYEGVMAVSSSETASLASSLHSSGGQAPQGGYGGYGGPQSGYGPQQGYGAPSQGYGPPAPPGAPQESGMDNILDKAQEMLAGAIKSGVAEKLLSGIFSSPQAQQPGGFQPHNAQYGQYPQGQQSFGNQQQMPQIGGEGSVGGLGSVGNILGSLASSLFSPPKESHHRNQNF